MNPSELRHRAIGGWRGVSNQTDQREQNRRFKQVHVVAIWECDIRWHASGLSELEVVGSDLAGECCPEADKGHERQYHECERRHGEHWREYRRWLHDRPWIASY